MRKLILVLTLTLAATTLRAQDAAPLQRLLAEQLAAFPGNAGVYVKNLTTGVEAGVRADQGFSTASIIKLTYMVRTYQLADQGKVTLDERVTIDRSMLRNGTGVLQYHDLGFNPTWRDVITEMIITSDNTATDLVLMKIGGPAVVTKWLTDSGYPQLQSFGRPHDYRRDLLALLKPEFSKLSAEETTGLMYASEGSSLFSLYKPMFAGSRAEWVAFVKDPANQQRLAKERNERTSTEKKYWLGSMTPRDTGRLLEGIEKGTAASKASCEAMLLTLRRQQLGARRLPHYIDVPVGHKTGDGGTIANDVGIIYAKSGPVVVAFFANGITGSYGEAEDRIGRLGQALVAFFDR